MFGLSRLLEMAGKITWQLKGRPSRRRLVRRAAPAVETLEDRVVPTLLGQQLFPSDYPWNQNISNAPVAANSAAIIAHVGGSIGLHPDWGQDSPANGSSPLYGIPVNVVHGNTTAKVNVVIDAYPSESDIVPVPIPANAVIEGDFQNGPNPATGYGTGARGDSHLIVWDEDNNVAYELFQATRPSEVLPSGQAHTDGMWHANQESVWSMKTDSFRSLGWTSADAAGLSILAGLARPDEGLPTIQGGQGAINHALRFTLPSGDVNAQYVYPASHVVNNNHSATNLPMGARLRLQNTAAVNAVIATLGPEAQIIAHAMQQYGLVLADIGSAMYVTGDSGSVDANNNLNLVWDMNDVLGLHKLTAGDFDVVDLTPRVTGLSAASGAAGTTITVIGQNFSGAAGHLSVFFGATAATSVTFVDDSHLSVVVPNGSGTVHVTVQSGVNAIDPNNPNDNVNNPIFGYGTSATSAADQFTFSGSTVSGSNSTIGFATATVASGNTDLLTIVVKDTTGNTVTGLANGAFNLSLSGGTSAGTFGTVAETATKGTYTCTFTATTAGTVSTVTASVTGVALTTKPTITVTPGAVSGTNSTVGFATPTLTLGGTDVVTIVVKDGAGNAISGLANGAFGFSLSGGTSTGTFGTITETATKGTYTGTFTATTAGTVSTLTATVSSVTLTTKPTVQVTSSSIGITPNPVVVKTNGELDLFNEQTGLFQILSQAGTIAFATPILDGSGKELVFAITQTPGYVGTLWEFNVATNSWAELSSGDFLQVSAATNASGQPVIFGLVSDHSLWTQNPVNPNLNAGWTLLSPAFTIDFITAITDSSGNPVVYVITVAGSGHQVWEHSPALPNNGWKQVSAASSQLISAGLNSAGQSEVFSVGSDGSLLQINPALNGGAPVLLSPAGTIVSATAGRGADTVFAITVAGRNLWEYSTASGWRQESTLSFAQLSATQNQSSTDVLFATLTDSSFGEFFNNGFTRSASGVAFSFTPR
jgi:hypothetical protein